MYNLIFTYLSNWSWWYGLLVFISSWRQWKIGSDVNNSANIQPIAQISKSYIKFIKIL